MSAEQSERHYPCSLDLFKKQAVSDVVEHGFVEYFYSKTLPRNGELEFVVEGNSDHMIVPSKTYLKLEVELEGKWKQNMGDGTTMEKTAAEATLSVVNNILQSCIESVDVYLSNQQIAKTDKHYPYVSYLQTLFNYGEEAQETYFELSGWSKDTAGKMDDISNQNEGFQKRRGFFVGKRNPKLVLIGKLNSPIFFQEKALPTQVSMKVVIKKVADKFCLLHEQLGDIKLKWVDAVLMVQKIQTVAGVQKTYIDMLRDGHPIPYFLKTPYVKYFTIEEGASQYMRDNVFLGKLPRRIVIGLVETAAYQGKVDKNPFNFQHFGLSEICLYKDGVPYPRPMIKMDIENEQCADAYHHFMTGINSSYSRHVPSKLTMNDYMNGFTFFCYNMSPDQCNTVHPGSLHNANSNIRMELKFKEALQKNITLLVYHELDLTLEIRQDRRVSVNE